MSGVAIALQGLLSLLLVAALAYGVRLERKLRDLREGQTGFAKAVEELNQAAGRAEAGLAMLRTSTEVAREELADRIDTARALTARLEAAASDAALAVKRLENLRHDASSPAPLGRWREASEGSRDSAEAASPRSPSARFANGPSAPSGHLPSRAGEDAHEPAARAMRRPRTDEALFDDAPAATPADRLRQVADLLRGPTQAAGGRR